MEKGGIIRHRVPSTKETNTIGIMGPLWTSEWDFGAGAPAAPLPWRLPSRKSLYVLGKLPDLDGRVDAT